jgi:hypothetical protein
MTWGMVAVAGATLVGGVMASGAQSDAANSASAAQQAASQAGIDEQRRQFDAVQKLLAPYANAGTGSLAKQQDLLGLNGNDAQAQAIQALQQSPAFTSQLKLGENSILANASATGGLRGGNTQAALAQFSPSLLAQTINDQYGRLGGMTSIGQNAAAMTGNAGMQTGNNVTNLLGQIGSAQAGNALAQGKASAGMWNMVPQLAGLFGGNGMSGFGGMSGLQSKFSQTSLGSSGFGSGLAYGNQDLGAFF